MQAAGDLAQLLQARVELAGRLVEQLAGALLVGPEPRAGQPQRQRDRDEPLLRAVVEVAFEPAAGLVARAHEPRREATRSSRACALASASEMSSQNAARRFSVSGGSGFSLAIPTAPHRFAADDDRRRGGRPVAGSVHRLCGRAR